MSWADGLVFGGFDDWRLPATIFPDAGCSIDGTGDGSFGGLGCTRSEMGHLFYDELLGTAGLSILTSGDAMELAKFTNIQDLCWSSTEFEINSPAAWLFLFSFGFQDADFKSGRLAAWAVRDGDVRAVPVPTAVLLFGSGLIGLIGLIGIARRKGRSYLMCL